MNKDVKEAVRNAIVLLIITFVSGLALGGVYHITEEPIAAQKELAVSRSCMAVFPPDMYASEGLSFVLTDIKPSDTLAKGFKENGVTVGNIYGAYSGEGAFEGYAIEVTSSEGYGGDIKIMCGISAEGRLNGVSILEISETAGLGMRAESVLVPQLHGLNSEHITFTKTSKQSPDEIDAISGATVTTTAFVNCVNASLDVFAEISSAEGGAS